MKTNWKNIKGQINKLKKAFSSFVLSCEEGKVFIYAIKKIPKESPPFYIKTQLNNVKTNITSMFALNKDILKTLSEQEDIKNIKVIYGKIILITKSNFQLNIDLKEPIYQKPEWCIDIDNKEKQLPTQPYLYKINHKDIAWQFYDKTIPHYIKKHLIVNISINKETNFKPMFKIINTKENKEVKSISEYEVQLPSEMPNIEVTVPYKHFVTCIKKVKSPFFSLTFDSLSDKKYLVFKNKENTIIFNNILNFFYN